MRLTSEQEAFLRAVRRRARGGLPEQIDGMPVVEKVFERPPWKKPKKRRR